MITADKIDEIVKNNKASQNDEELRQLLKLLSSYKENYRHILEIGTHKGYSMDIWSEAFNPSTLVGIESNKPPEKQIHNILFMKSQEERTLDEVKRLFPVGIDFLFIDGDHMFDAVKKDYEMYSPLVRAGGVIVLHDIAVKDNPTVEIAKFWETIRDDVNYTLINKDGGQGYIVIFK